MKVKWMDFATYFVIYDLNCIIITREKLAFICRINL